MDNSLTNEELEQILEETEIIDSVTIPLNEKTELLSTKEYASFLLFSIFILNMAES